MSKKKRTRAEGQAMCLNLRVKSIAALVFFCVLFLFQAVTKGGVICEGARHKAIVLSERPLRFEKDFEEYKKFLESDGFLVVGLEGVSYSAMREASYIINHILSGRGDIRKGLIDDGVYCVVAGSVDERIKVSEHFRLEREAGYSRESNSVSKSSGGEAIFCSEENLLNCASGEVGCEVVLVGELAGSIYANVLERQGDFANWLKGCYADVRSKGLWRGSIASGSTEKYWAEGVQAWFDCNGGEAKANGRHNFASTREELQSYDPNLAELVGEVFRGNQWRYRSREKRGGREFPYLKKLRERTGRLESYQCKLEYLFKQPILESKSRRRGVLYYQRFGDKSKLRISFLKLKQDEFAEEDYREEYIFDGVWLKQIDYQIKSVKLIQESEPNEPVGAFDLAKRNFPVIGFSSTEEMEREFEIEVSEDTAQFIKYHLVVKDGSIYEGDYKVIDFWVDKKSVLPSKIEARTAEGEVYEIKFLEPRVDKPIRKEVFDVEIPDGFGEPEVVPLEKRD